MTSDKDENVINNGKHVVLFHLLKYSDKLYGNIVYKMQIEMSSLTSDKDENVINNGKHVVLFHLLKYSDKLYGNIVYKMQIEMSSFIQVPH